MVALLPWQEQRGDQDASAQSHVAFLPWSAAATPVPTIFRFDEVQTG